MDIERLYPRIFPMTAENATLPVTPMANAMQSGPISAIRSSTEDVASGPKIMIKIASIIRP
ncbi:hypothetical protein PWEIH_02142 [Listeria weihenstephanensis FSL R9-0317]|nr:hypothetical protein PWEIH_02142 [Listeria weihenstephanensis FSL R9-0317]